MSNSKILNVQKLGFQWQTQDPFLFCVHHEDFYPKGKADMSPDASLAGRMIGSDFEVKDGWLENVSWIESTRISSTSSSWF